MNIICEILIEFIKKICNCFIPERDESALIYVYKENSDIENENENENENEKEKENIRMNNYTELNKYYSCYQSPQ